MNNKLVATTITQLENDAIIAISKRQCSSIASVVRQAIREFLEDKTI